FGFSVSCTLLVARTPQQNGVDERKNRTLIEAARTMLADSKFPTTFWAEAVNIACYVQNRVLVIKPHNKTPYELFLGRKPTLSFMRPFGCPVTILNTLDHLGKFDGKADEGFFIGYSTNSKAFRVFNSRTRIVDETLHITFLENKPNVAGSGPTWLFDIDTRTKSMNYKPVFAGNQTNGNAGTKENIDAGQSGKKTVPDQDYILLPLCTKAQLFSSSSKESPDAGFKPSGEEEKKDAECQGNEVNEVPRQASQSDDLERTDNTNTLSAASSNGVNVVGAKSSNTLTDDPNMPNLEEIVYSDDDEDVGAEADMTNLDTNIPVSPIPTTRIHKDHPVEQIIGDLHSTPQTRRMAKTVTEHAQEGNPSIERSKLDRSYARRASAIQITIGLDIGGFAIWQKGYWLFLAYASFEDFVVYQMDVTSAFLYGKIEEEVYVCQPPRFEDLEFPDKVYKVEKALYGLHQALRAWYETLSTYLLDNGFQRGQIDKTLFIKKIKGDIILVQVYVDDIILGSTKKELCTEFKKLMHKKFWISSMGELTFFLGLQVTQQDDGIFICQDKYVDEILKKFSFSTVKTASTPIETSKPLLKDENAKDVNVHLYRSIIGSLMYLTSSKPDIIYLKGQPKLGLWYPKDSPFDLEASIDSDYAGASLNRKSTTRAEYVAASSCCGQVLWIQNQMLDFGYNFINTKIFIDNESTIFIVKNLVFHSKTKHIEIRHHFIRDSYENRLIQVIKIHTDHNVADLLKKAFDATTNVKTVNGEEQIQALVDKKKVIIIETSVRRDFHLDDGEGTECLPNATIFEQLTLMGAKTTAWNEFSSTMASAIILFLDNQVEGMLKHKEIYVTPSHTKKVFANMKREGNFFSGNVTPLFQTMMVQAPEEVGEGSGIPTDPHHTPTVSPPSSEIPNEESVPTTSNDPLPSGEDRMQLNELMTLCTNLQKQVLDLKEAKTAQAKEIASLKKRVKKLEKRKKSKTPGLKRLRKGRRIADIDQDVEITLIDETQGRINEEKLFGVNDLDGDEVIVDVTIGKNVKQSVKDAEKEVSTADLVTTAFEVVTTASEAITIAGVEDSAALTIPVTTAAITLQITKDELTLAQTLIEIKAAKPKAITTAITRPMVRGVMIQEPSKFSTTTSSSQPSQLPQAKNKGKGIMVEPEKPLKKKDQIMADEEVARNQGRICFH
ncbi:putative ribonuclease H-like domain-containing protein, partial [Tanacetum coccineum]